MTDEDRALHEAIAEHVDAAAAVIGSRMDSSDSRRTKWIAGAIVTIAVGALSIAVGLGGIKSEITAVKGYLSSLNEQVGWLVREKIPELEKEHTEMKLRTAPGILPEAKIITDAIMDEQDDLRHELQNTREELIQKGVLTPGRRD